MICITIAAEIMLRYELPRYTEITWFLKSHHVINSQLFNSVYVAEVEINMRKDISIIWTVEKFYLFFKN